MLTGPQQLYCVATFFQDVSVYIHINVSNSNNLRVFLFNEHLLLFLCVMIPQWFSVLFFFVTHVMRPLNRQLQANSYLLIYYMPKLFIYIYIGKYIFMSVHLSSWVWKEK